MKYHSFTILLKSFAIIMTNTLSIAISSIIKIPSILHTFPNAQRRAPAKNQPFSEI